MIGAKSAVLQRRLKIADWIRLHGQMRVDELSAALMVSEVTIRGDLSYLEEQGLIVRSFGKAIATKSAAPRDRPANAPLAKALLVPMLRRAQSLIEPDQTVLIGPGDLTMQVIPWLGEIPGLSVLLANVAAIPLARSCLDARVHVLGGEINAETGALEGAQTIRALDHYPLAWAIIEADALSADAVLLLATKSAERLGEAALRRAARSIVLIGNQALSLERRSAHLPLAGVSDIILPSVPSNRARDILLDAGFRPTESDGGNQTHFCSRRPVAERAARTAGGVS